MKVYHVYASRRYILVAENETDAIEVAFTNGCVRKRENVKKVVDITEIYKESNSTFDVNSVGRGELAKIMNGKTTSYKTHLKET